MEPPARAHGVTPELSRDYVTRTAEHQAAFVLPYLRPGMSLVDVGCGPGSITVGLAAAVAPGRVIGIDHDAAHVRAAAALAAERGVRSASFQVGDAFALPFEDGTLDAAFENDMLVHLAARAPGAVAEAMRILKPGAWFAARDAAADAAIRMPDDERLSTFDRAFFAWQESRGSDITLGRRLPGIVRRAGFAHIRTSVSADTKGTPQEVLEHAGRMTRLLDGPVGAFARERGLLDEADIGPIREAIEAWGREPDAFFANVHVEVIGRKPD